MFCTFIKCTDVGYRTEKPGDWFFTFDTGGDALFPTEISAAHDSPLWDHPSFMEWIGYPSDPAKFYNTVKDLFNEYSVHHAHTMKSGLNLFRLLQSCLILVHRGLDMGDRVIATTGDMGSISGFYSVRVKFCNYGIGGRIVDLGDAELGQNELDINPSPSQLSRAVQLFNEMGIVPVLEPDYPLVVTSTLASAFKQCIYRVIAHKHTVETAEYRMGMYSGATHQLAPISPIISNGRPALRIRRGSNGVFEERIITTHGEAWRASVERLELAISKVGGGAVAKRFVDEMWDKANGGAAELSSLTRRLELYAELQAAEVYDGFFSNVFNHK